MIEVLKIRGKNYSLEKIKKISEKIPISILPTDELYLADYTGESDDDKNMEHLDTQMPILIITGSYRNPEVVYGKDEVLEARQRNIKTMRVKWITLDVLNSCQI